MTTTKIYWYNNDGSYSEDYIEEKKEPLPEERCGLCRWWDIDWKKEDKCFCLWNGDFHYEHEKSCWEFCAKKKKQSGKI